MMSHVKKVCWLFFVVFSLTGILFSGAKIGLADEMTFQVEPQFPDNQMEKNGYFDLLMKPDQEQVIRIKVSNTGKKDVKISPKVYVARTNSNGVVEYGNSADKSDKTLPYDITELVTPLKEDSSIAPNKTEELQFKIKMPKEPYKGSLVGGIILEDKNAKEKAESENEGMNIVNTFSYSVAIVLKESEEKLAPNLTLGKVEANQDNARNVVAATLHNPVATFINQVKIDAKVFKQGKADQTVLHSIKSSMQIAPNSYFAYPIPYNGKKMVPGKYTLDMVVSTNKGDEWKFKRDFEITRDEAKKFNDKDVSIEPEEETNWILIAGIIIGVIIILLLIYLIYRKKQKDNDKKESKSHHSSKRRKSSSGSSNQSRSKNNQSSTKKRSSKSSKTRKKS